MDHLPSPPAFRPCAEPDLRPLRDLPSPEIYLLDAETWQVKDASESACRNLQYAAAEIRTRRLPDLCPSCTPAFTQRLLDSPNAGGRRSAIHAVEWRRKDGSSYRAAISLEPLIQPDGMLLIALAPPPQSPRQMKKILLEPREGLERAVRAAGLGIREWRVEANDFHDCPAVRQLLGLKRNDRIRTLDAFLARIHPDDHALIQQTARQCLLDGKKRRIEYRRVGPAGEIHWLAERCQAVAGPSGHYDKLVGVMADITEQKRVETALKTRERWLAMVLDHLADGIITMNGRGTIETANAAASSLFGYQADEMVGRNISLLMPLPDCERDDGRPHHDLAAGQAILSGAGRYEIPGVRKDGTCFPLELTTSEMRQDGRRLFIGIARDITERKETARRMEYLAHYDSLTALPNRTFFMKQLEVAISATQQTGRQVALMFLDLDGFKEINDSIGHQAGDQMLMTVATRIRNCLRAQDMVARLGGDEFTVLLEGVSKSKHAAAIARKILDCFNDPIALCGQAFDVTASIGIALYPADAATGQGMLEAADIAMYAAKNSGRNNYQFFQPGSQQAPDQAAPASRPAATLFESGAPGARTRGNVRSRTGA